MGCGTSGRGNSGCGTKGVAITGVVYRGVAIVGGGIFFCLHQHSAMEDHEDGFIDMSREFTCYLCNGYTTMIGSISINETGITLTNAAG